MRPVIERIDSFDAQEGCSISFYYADPNIDDAYKSYGSLLRVYKVNDFSTPIYTHEVTTMSEQNSIDGGVLINGEQYAADLISYNNSHVPSEPSNKVFFWCYATPVFRFTNVSDGEIFNEQSVTAQLLYEQSDEIEISQFKYALYDSQGALITETSYLTNYDDNNSFTYSGLENDEIYIIRAYGLTTANQVLDTGYITIFIQFEAPDAYSVLYANADNGNGVIEYNTNIKLIESNRPRESYEYDADMINLENDRIVYDTNFVIAGDFIMAIRHKYTVGEILTCSNAVNGFRLRIIACTEDNTYRYKLSVPNELCEYTLYSNPFTMDENKLMTCWIKRVRNLYELKVFVETDTSDEYNLFLGLIRPSNDITRYDVWINLDYEPTVRIDKEDVVIWKQLTEPANPAVNDIWIDIDTEG